MDRFEKIAYSILFILAVLYGLALIVGMMAAFPFGLLGLAAMVAFGLLFIKVLCERMNSKEDDYYDKHVEK